MIVSRQDKYTISRLSHCHCQASLPSRSLAWAWAWTKSYETHNLCHRFRVFELTSELKCFNILQTSSSFPVCKSFNEDSSITAYYWANKTVDLCDFAGIIMIVNLSAPNVDVLFAGSQTRRKSLGKYCIRFGGHRAPARNSSYIAYRRALKQRRWLALCVSFNQWVTR